MVRKQRKANAKTVAEEEYMSLADLVTNKRPTDDNMNTLYDELMTKEKRVLDVVERLIEDKQNHDYRKTMFVDIPLSKLPFLMLKEMNEFMTDVMEIRGTMTVEKFKRLVNKNHRLVYIGILLVLIALGLMLVNISESV
jgi:allophanate hydrolase subunit 1